MNTNLKEILKHGEEEFNPQAWENLAKKLDAKMPVNKPNYLSGKNIFIAGASALFIGSGIFFFINQGEEKKLSENISKEKQIVKTEEIIPNNTAETKTYSTENSTINSKNISKQQNLNFKDENQIIDEKESNLISELKEKKYESNFKDDDKKFSLPDINYSPFVLPTFENYYCQNEKILISNSNKTKLSILDENNNIVLTIFPKESKHLTLEKSGTYYGKYLIEDNLNSKYLETKLFSVHQVDEINFTFQDKVLFDNGVPYIQLESSDFSEKTSWSSDKGQISEQSEKTKLTVFRKGNYNVNLTLIDHNNCEVKKTQKIEVSEEYNLLAPTAFIPTDLDARNNRFMPFALTQRNLSFEMLIVDAENGKIVFKTTSSENSWDGVDINTGQIVKSNKSFIWKVNIKNPAFGEKSEYSGTIVKL